MGRVKLLLVCAVAFLVADVVVSSSRRWALVLHQKPPIVLYRLNWHVLKISLITELFVSSVLLSHWCRSLLLSLVLSGRGSTAVYLSASWCFFCPLKHVSIKALTSSSISARFGCLDCCYYAHVSTHCCTTARVCATLVTVRIPSTADCNPVFLCRFALKT